MLRILLLTGFLAACGNGSYLDPELVKEATPKVKDNFLYPEMVEISGLHSPESGVLCGKARALNEHGDYTAYFRFFYVSEQKSLAMESPETPSFPTFYSRICGG